MKNTKTTLITGASSGIGLEMARECARKGDNLILVARSEQKLEQLADELQRSYSAEVTVFSADLAKTAGVEELIATVDAAGLQVDHLINNAGFGDWGAFTETDWSKEANMIDLNVRALTQLTKHYLPQMVKRGYGRVMNVASTAAFFPGPLMAVYYATKHFVLNFSESLAREVKGTGVTVTALCPGPTESNFQQAAEMEDSALVKGKKLPSSAEVATFGIAAMHKGEVVAVHGMQNKLTAWMSGLMPRGLKRNLVYNMQKAK
jgi:hypothetical protein